MREDHCNTTPNQEHIDASTEALIDRLRKTIANHEKREQGNLEAIAELHEGQKTLMSTLDAVKKKNRELSNEKEVKDATIGRLRNEIADREDERCRLQRNLEHSEQERRRVSRALLREERANIHEKSTSRKLGNMLDESNRDIEALLHFAQPVQMRALTDHLLANYGNCFGDPDKRRQIRSTCEDLGARTGLKVNELQFLFRVAVDEGNKMAHSVSTRALALAIDSLQEAQERSTWDTLFKLVLGCDAQDYLASSRDETFEVTRARHQGATDLYRPIQGTGGRLPRSRTTGGLDQH